MIFVPGIGGSTLTVGKTIVFGNLRTAFSDFGAITLPGTRLKPGKVIGKVAVLSRYGRRVYEPFFAFLRQRLGYEEGRDFFPFPYDWRQSCRDSGMRLRQFIWDIGRRPEFRNTKLTIVAHSMGGLVARYCARLDGMPERISRIITAGTPHRGSPDALGSLLYGKSIFFGDYAQEDTIPALRSFPSTYELLPFESGYITDDHGATLDISDMGLWGWLSERQRWHLQQAYAFHRFISDGPDPVPVHSIYGHGQPTLLDFELPIYRAKRLAERGIILDPWRLIEHAQLSYPSDGRSGDDTVPETGAIRDHHLICPVKAHHDKLLNGVDAQRYIRDMLTPVAEVSVAGDAPANAAQLMVYLDGQRFSRSENLTLRMGLLDAHGNYVRNARFRVDVHRVDERGYSKSFFGPLYCDENGGLAGELALLPWVVSAPGSYYFHVTVVDACGATLNSTHQEVDFQIE